MILRGCVGMLLITVFTSTAQAATYDVWLKPSPESDKVCAQGKFNVETGRTANTELQTVEVIYRVVENSAPCEAFALGRLGSTFTDNATATLSLLPLREMTSSRIKQLSGGFIVAYKGSPQEEDGWQASGKSGSYLVVNSAAAHIPVAATLPLFVFGMAAIAFARLCRKAARISP